MQEDALKELHKRLAERLLERIKEKDAKETVDTINSLIEEEVVNEKKKNGNREVKRAKLPYENQEGKFVLNFRMVASGINGKTNQPFTQKPDIFDHNVERWDNTKKIWGDSIIRVTFIPHAYNNPAIGIGCSLWLKSVQVKTWVEGSSGVDNYTKVEPGQEKEVPF
jgi:hypothetical protein